MMDGRKKPTADMPRLFDVFDHPEIKSVRASTSIRQNVDINKIKERIVNARQIRTSGKDVIKYEEGRGKYVLIFPSGYVQVHAPSQEGIRDLLKSLRNELYEVGILR
ncbi:MAG: hypothetical protein ACLFUR_02080 [Candidatus Hadarchaeia archaeon]